MYEFKVSRIENNKIYVKNKNNNEYMLNKDDLVDDVKLVEGDLVIGWLASSVFYPKAVPRYEDKNGKGSSIKKSIK